MSRLDLLVVGAGPAGMSAALEARRHGLEVMVIDDQPAPGGQIWRSVESAGSRDDILGASFAEGRPVAEAFRASGALYEPSTQLWALEPGFRAYVSSERHTRVLGAEAVLLCTGAQERPVPFPGWTLPGVLTVGAAQILLKNAGQIPAGPLWIAGSGPLPLLYITQLLKAGGEVAGLLDTTPPGQWTRALPHLPQAMGAAADLLKGLKWMAALRASKMHLVRGVADLEAIGHDRIEALRYRTRTGVNATVEVAALLVHEGVVPNLHPAASLDCALAWNAAQDCFTPILDAWGESSQANIFIAGDGAGIAGAKAALLRGQLAALRVAMKLGRVSERQGAIEAGPLRRNLARELALRPFLDAMYRPRPEVFAPSDATIVCRCEEITAGDIRRSAGVAKRGPNQVKFATRAGMGPCQGRQCGYTITRIVSAAQGRAPDSVGFFHVRPPLKPVTVGELAALHRAAPP
jgi:NADPH-dependent 2,4-dienoyl-CoA reductase/sulfur reductase-like enzyme